MIPVNPTARAIVTASGGGPMQRVATSATSASAGPFTTGNFFTGSSDPELSADSSIAILWYADAYESDDKIWGNSSASTGWYARLTSGSGSVGDTYGYAQLTLAGGTGTFNGQRYKLGLNCTIFTHTAGGDIKQSTNGCPAETISAGVTYVATSGATHTLGKASTSGAATNQKLIEVAYFDAAVSDADMQTISGVIAENESYRLNATARSHPNLVWSNHFDDDWDGGATSVNGRGSGSNTFTKSGTVAQNTIAAEDVYTYDRSLLHDTLAATDETDYYGADCWSRLRLTTDAESIRVRVRQEGTWFNWYKVGTDQDGVAGPHGDIVETAGSTTCADIIGLTAGSKTLDVYPGLHAGSRLGLFHTGKFSVPAGSSVVAVAPTAPTNRCVIVGDSISVGQDANQLTEKAWSLQLRRLLGSTWGVTSDGYGSRAIAIDAGDLTGLAETIVARLDGTTRNVVIWEVGTVDWGAAYGTSKATWKSRVETTIDHAKSEFPGLELIAITPFPRTGEDTPNAGAAVLQDYRDALNELAATRAWMSVIEGPEIVPEATGLDSDGLHLNNDGSDFVAETVRATLTSTSIGEAGWGMWIRHSADVGVGSGQATWSNQQQTAADFTEVGTIELNSADADWNSQDVFALDGSTEYWEVDESQLSRTTQRVLHNGTESYWGWIVFRSDDGSGDIPLVTTQVSATVGIQLMQRISSEFVRFSIYGATQYFATSANGSAPAGVEQVAFFRYDAGSNQVGVRAQGGSWVNGSTVASPDAGDANSALRLCANGSGASVKMTGELAKFGIRRGLPSAALEASIEAQIVAQYGL